MRIENISHRITLLHTESEERLAKPGEQGELLVVRFQQELEGAAARRNLEVRWDSGIVEILEEGKDFWNVYTQDDEPQIFRSVEFGPQIPSRVRTSVSESHLNRIRFQAIETYSKQIFSEKDDDLALALALLWQFYVLLHRLGGQYNGALVEEFKSRMAGRSFQSQVSPSEQHFDFRDLTVEEIISRARRAAHNLNKFNHSELVDVSFEDSQKEYMWQHAESLDIDAASELMFVALCEFEDFQGARITIHDPKRLIINCLEKMKLRGEAMYKFACYSSKDEYVSIAQDDAEIFGCVAHSEEEAIEIARSKGYWLVELIGIQAI